MDIISLISWIVLSISFTSFFLLFLLAAFLLGFGATMSIKNTPLKAIIGSLAAITGLAGSAILAGLFTLSGFLNNWIKGLLGFAIAAFILHFLGENQLWTMLKDLDFLAANTMLFYLGGLGARAFRSLIGFIGFTKKSIFEGTSEAFREILDFKLLRFNYRQKNGDIALDFNLPFTR